MRERPLRPLRTKLCQALPPVLPPPRSGAHLRKHTILDSRATDNAHGVKSSSRPANVFAAAVRPSPYLQKLHHCSLFATATSASGIINHKRRYSPMPALRYGSSTRISSGARARSSPSLLTSWRRSSIEAQGSSARLRSRLGMRSVSYGPRDTRTRGKSKVYAELAVKERKFALLSAGLSRGTAGNGYATHRCIQGFQPNVQTLG